MLLVCVPGHMKAGVTQCWQILRKFILVGISFFSHFDPCPSYFFIYPATPVSAALSITRQDLLVYTLSWPRLEVAAATQEAVTHNLTSAVLHQVSLGTATMIVVDYY